MLLKKKLILGSVLAIMSLPVISHADLLTYNDTNEESTVKITSAAGQPCSGTFGHYTSKKGGDPAHNPDVTNLSGVRLLCHQLVGSGTCTATMYATRNCTGNPIAYLSMAIPSLKVTVLQTLSPYKVVTEGDGTVRIKYDHA
jgi:hypothetical protein